MSAILVVDDDLINRLTLKHMLQKGGYSVTVAEHGAQALELLRSGLQPDIILMDIEMPVMNGRETLHILKTDADLRERFRGPVVALTAHSLAADKQQIREDGFEGIICKPIDEKDLLAALAAFLAADG